jgi:hypothetical protein
MGCYLPTSTGSKFWRAIFPCDAREWDIGRGERPHTKEVTGSRWRLFQVEVRIFVTWSSRVPTRWGCCSKPLSEEGYIWCLGTLPWSGAHRYSSQTVSCCKPGLSIISQYPFFLYFQKMVMVPHMQFVSCMHSGVTCSFPMVNTTSIVFTTLLSSTPYWTKACVVGAVEPTYFWEACKDL